MQQQSTHAALVMTAPGQMRIEQVPTKRPRAGEILVASLRAGICGSDLDMMRGIRPLGTRILGHEGVAKVVAVGSDTSPFAAGQYVTFWPNNPTDANDTLGASTDGLFQQYLLIPQAALERGMVIPFETEIPLTCGPLSEPFATVIYGYQIVQQVIKPESIVVVGAGPIGLLTALYAKAHGCSRIFLVDASQARLNWAVKRGIVDDSYAILNSPQLADTVLERMGQQGIDAAFLCTPRSATRPVLTQALRFIREDGCIDLAAGTDSSDEFAELPGVDLDATRHANVCGIGHEVGQCLTRAGKRLWLTGHSGASPSYLQEAMKLLRDDPAHYARVISHTVPYRAAPAVFEHRMAATRHDLAGEPFVKVIIDFTSEGQEIEVFQPEQSISRDIPKTERH